jgi:hypothetical protein
MTITTTIVARPDSEVARYQVKVERVTGVRST